MLGPAWKAFGWLRDRLQKHPIAEQSFRSGKQSQTLGFGNVKDSTINISIVGANEKGEQPPDASTRRPEGEPLSLDQVINAPCLMVSGLTGEAGDGISTITLSRLPGVSTLGEWVTFIVELRGEKAADVEVHFAVDGGFFDDGGIGTSAMTNLSGRALVRVFVTRPRGRVTAFVGRARVPYTFEVVDAFNDVFGLERTDTDSE